MSDQSSHSNFLPQTKLPTAYGHTDGDMMRSRLSRTGCTFLQRSTHTAVDCAASAGCASLANLKHILSLERSIGQQIGKDQALWGTSRFNVSVYPDLPAIMKWSDILQLPQR